MPTPPDTDNSSNTSPDGSANNDAHERALSPAPSSSALSSTVETVAEDALPSSNTAAVPSTAATSPIGPPPAKRRKLTPSEKLEKQHAKEVAERERTAAKARKEEEKRVKDEEKRRKDEEKAEAKRAQDEEKRRKAEEKEAKKREKELDEQRKTQEKEAKKREQEEEKLKKERSQLRLGSFFQRPATPAKAASADNENQPRARRRSTSREQYDHVADKIASPIRATPPPVSEKKPSVPKPTVSAYHRAFLPFELQSHSRMAITHKEASDAAQEVFDRELKDPSLQEQYDLGMISTYHGYAELEHYFRGQRGLDRGMNFPATRDIVDRIQGTANQPIDLTEDQAAQPAVEVLRDLPTKHLHFAEDVRPPYCGTYNKIRSPGTRRKVRRNPFTRARPDTNYDYDSEAEWEEPEEGDEEVLSDEDDEADSQADADDIEGFLDDAEDTVKGKRKMITGELVPGSTGLCWANDKGRISVVESIEVETQPVEMRGMSMDVLLPGLAGKTIDPFSTAYWDAPTATPAPGLSVNDRPTSTMAPPRQPLQPRLNPNGTLDKEHDLVGATQGVKGPITTVAALQGAKRGPKPAPKTLSKEDLEEFKEAVIGSPIGKLELQKGLKARFPKMTNEVIKETLSSRFAQVGKGKAEKHWVFIGQS
ncbi:hypothetical protein DOTSEDRAFT_173229 [Dothistroma septosporum NZE10]|uniref:Chromatin assembly factor 1 subunit A n=1 Tax=Dothistroma septosporum (strain NZE10 / CBS 128990) TaxID=675120 RepID=M2XJW1_DOTSN|nr:hypothetical protein DOTSEDRAFT_173229 [Dothistroma septosporum NZE10]